MWMNSSTCFLIASTTRGCECPVEQTATPALKSRKMLPSTSSIIAPFARLMTNGYGRVYEGEMYFASRSTISLALGPGNSVLIWGTFADFSSAEPFISFYLQQSFSVYHSSFFICHRRRRL